MKEMMLMMQKHVLMMSVENYCTLYVDHSDGEGGKSAYFRAEGEPGNVPEAGSH